MTTYDLPTRRARYCTLSSQIAHLDNAQLRSSFDATETRHGWGKITSSISDAQKSLSNVFHSRIWSTTTNSRPKTCMASRPITIMASDPPVLASFVNLSHISRPPIGSWRGRLLTFPCCTTIGLSRSLESARKWIWSATKAT